MAKAMDMWKSLSAYSSLLRPDELRACNEFLSGAISQAQNDHSQLLSTIPRSSDASYGSIVTLSCLMAALPSGWPVLKLQQTYTEFWNMIPEEAKSGQAAKQAQQLLDRVVEQCKCSYSSLIDLLDSSSSTGAIIDPETGRYLHHRGLSALIRNFGLPLVAISGRSKPVIAISLPNGPLLACTVLATATYYTAAPVAHGSDISAEQFKADVLQLKSNMVLASGADIDRLRLRDRWLAEAGIQVLIVTFTDKMQLLIRTLDCAPSKLKAPMPTLNSAHDTGIILFTSGTSGTKKLVPLSIHSMVCGVAMVIDSWGLSPSMRCLNQMPLYHIGGLIRNLFAPVLSGGSVICCSAFDANLFWDCVEDYAPTWYYASPSMHQCILEAGIDRPESIAKSKMRLVCNAAGGLLPSLACQLRDTFTTKSVECKVLPSYGMTECMPISTPPLNYKLERAGTSGTSVGPEISILNGKDRLEQTGTVGRIAVRGSPVFSGYLNANNIVEKTCFTENGWFDTGDIGYLDAEGYLYITGRSKEVINRGGEVISPFEIEEAVVAAASNPESRTFGRIGKALAFSATHDVLQEVVAIAVVTPKGAKRTCLRDVQESVKSLLSSAKVPMLIVYMDGGLPTNNNKLLRIKLADRLRLPEISDSTPQAQRHYEAISPPPNTPLSMSIECSLLQITHDCLTVACQCVVPQSLDIHVRTYASDFYSELLLAPKADFSESVGNVTPDSLIEKLAESLHGYNLPSKVVQLEEPFPRNTTGSVDDVAMDKLFVSQNATDGDKYTTATERVVASVFSQILALPFNELSSSSHFFQLGGNSMAAGQLLAKLRKEFQLRLPIDVLFTNSQIKSLSALIDEKLPNDNSANDASKPNITVEEILPGCENACSSTRPLLMLLQLIPIGVVYPMKRALTLTIFLYFLTLTHSWLTNQSIPGKLLHLFISVVVARICTKTVAPIFGIACKWLVIGRYKTGLYPMWGSFHTRWWFTQKVIAIAGMGNFGMFNWSRVTYFRLLGAKIGSGVSLARGATLGEYDLVTIRDNAVLECCTVRPFAAERNTFMYLGRITIGANASIGLKSIVAAGTTVPDDACVGPNSSSWELSDANESNRNLAASKIPETHWALSLFVGAPIQILTAFFGTVPRLSALVPLVAREPKLSITNKSHEGLIWFLSSKQVAYHCAALAAKTILGPAFFFLAAYVFKKFFDLFCGPIKPSNASNRSQMTNFRMQLMRSLMPEARFRKLTELFGTHYEMTSILARRMGAKVGSRVYWPGIGPSIQDFSLLEVGDDVVFGSRSHLVTSDGTGSDYIHIKSGTMVADRVVLLPGVELGEKTVMGSGALTMRHRHYAPGTTWIGAKSRDALCLTVGIPLPVQNSYRSSQYQETANAQRNFDSGSSNCSTLVNQSDADSSSISKWNLSSYNNTDIERGRHSSIAEIDSESSSPFGRAFYQKRAPYHVWGQFDIFCYSAFIAVLNAVWWNASYIFTMQIIGRVIEYRGFLYRSFLSTRHWYHPITFWIFLCIIIVAIMALQSMLVICFIINSKWLLLGRRKQGNYDWDKSSYCQRWQLFLKLEMLRCQCYGGYGILGMLTGTHWCVMYFRAMGAHIGRDCALFAGGLPSLIFTEPELLTLGDRVTIDDASLVGHINTRGKFDLNPLFVGDRSVLRSGSRLLSGAIMEEDTCLLEHTLVMAGDIVEAGSTYQGWPAEQFTSNRMPTIGSQQV